MASSADVEVLRSLIEKMIVFAKLPRDDLSAIVELVELACDTYDRELLLVYINILNDAALGIRSEIKRPAGIDYIKLCRGKMLEARAKKLKE